ncbi:MAG: transglutaminase domain-containing protein [Parasporobacterium sp.]|nr:transglutaminase domain-containing protein [Parasporobacterium sp.]
MYLVTALVLIMLAGAFFYMRTRSGENARWPEEGSWVQYSGLLAADLSNTSQGYFMAWASQPTSQRLKLRVVFNGTNLDYDLPGDGTSIVVPLQMGSGSYQVLLYENVSGKKYAEAGSLWLDAWLDREDIAFLYPNQYVDYTELSAAVEQADALCAGKSNMDAFQAVCSFMKSGFVYDFVKALTVKAGTLPDIDGSYEKRMGVCQDLSAIMCCMLRTQGIPSRLVIGYADDNYHAWTVTDVDGEEVFFDPTAELSAISRVKTYSVERFY